MNELPDQRADAAALAQRELARLNGQVEAMRGVLVRLLQDVVRAEKQLDNNHATQLVEANEHLVITALGAQAVADTAVGALEEASRSGGLDSLTGLPNRAVLKDRLANAIANAKRHGNRVALLFLDINNFKQINDTFGHAAGDQALQLVADCLTSLVRETDTVSRHGGDEFLVMLAEVAHAADAGFIADKVNAALGEFSRIDHQVVRLTASIGISVYPEDGEDAQTLIDRADAAMYLAKKHRLGGFAFHADQPPGSPTLPAPSVQSQQRRLTHHELTVADHEHRHSVLQEANERLVLAALGAQELQAAAEAAQRRQAELLVAVAKELSDPFAPIRIAAAMLGRPDAEQALSPLAQAIVDQQVNNVSRMIAGLLDPAKLDKAEMTLDRRTFDVGTTVADVVQACRPAMDARLQTLVVDVPTTPIDVHADPALIALALTNLLDNATAYTQKGGRIGLSVEVAGNACVMTVSDDGAGIAPETLATIFDPFVRDPRASAAHKEGLGLGLTVVRTIVEAHGGCVVANSAGVGQGSQFVVSIPMVGLPLG